MAIAFAPGISLGPQDPPPVDFRSQVLPVLADRCFVCHGPDAGSRKAGLRLDTRAGATAQLGGQGAARAAIVPGDAEASQLLARIVHADTEERMPPQQSGPALTDEQAAVLRAWIEQGAAYETHWSFEPPVRGQVPQVRDRSWPRDDLDRFVLARLEQRGLPPAGQADALVWLRRASFAATGLPPSENGVAAFAAAHAMDPIAARRAAVDRLLASPHFGERMATPWLDLARYADTFGYQSDVARRVWPYRDWVIAAYNDNLPYDQFVRDQLAGDLLPEATRAQRTATAFNRLHRQTNEGGSVEEEYRVEYVSDRVHTVGTAFLGLTFECARCHDHKFDPISQRDYYRLTDYFDDIDECGLYSHFTNATPTPALDLPSSQQEQQLFEIEQRVAVAAGELDRLLAAGSGKQPRPRPQAWFSFDERTDKGFVDALHQDRFARAEGQLRQVDGKQGQAVQLLADEGLRFPDVGKFSRWQPFSVSYWLRVDEEVDRAVLLHRSKSWTDAGSQGWQMLLDDGRVLAALVHFWPGDAVAVRTTSRLPLQKWSHLVLTYDGSSQVQGLCLYVNGELAETEVLADHLTRKITGGGPGDCGFGTRFRDRAFVAGALDEVRFFEARLVAAQIEGLAAESPDPIDEGSFEAAEVEAARARLQALRKERDELRDRIPQLMVMRESSREHRAHLLARGSYTDPVEAVGRGVPEFLAGEAQAQPRNRLELASWLFVAEHPMTARVEVDRLWRVVFGRGLVRTPEDFGTQGAQPTHPRLLDWLAVEFRESGWDRKALLRRMLLSATFAQSSRADADRRRLDPENQFWSRGPSMRLTAEMLRDQVLCASGLLVPKIGGAAVKPYQPAGLWKEKSGKVYKQSEGEGLYRRSLYTFWKRTSPPPAMMVLDAAKRDVCVARRQATATPLQALVLWNDPQFGEAARVLAADLLAAHAEDRARLHSMFVRWPGGRRDLRKPLRSCVCWPNNGTRLPRTRKRPRRWSRSGQLRAAKASASKWSSTPAGAWSVRHSWQPMRWCSYGDASRVTQVR